VDVAVSAWWQDLVVTVPRTRFASVGGDRVAYQVWGEGPVDLVVDYGSYSHLELNWEVPAVVRFLERLGRSVRVIQFDRRGTGLSDRPDRPPTLEDRVDDVVAVVEAAGCGQVALLGESEGAATSLLFAAAHPERVSHLVLYGSLVRALRSDEYPWGVVETRAEYESVVELIIEGWGESSAARMWSRAAREEELGLIARYQQMAISPKGFRNSVLGDRGHRHPTGPRFGERSDAGAAQGGPIPSSISVRVVTSPIGFRWRVWWSWTGRHT
jgi:pimeloyl-ACP methyl ester carboxylesterase